MRSPGEFFSTATGQLVLVGLLAAIAGVAAYWKQTHKPASLPPPPNTTTVSPRPKTFLRDGARFPKPVSDSAAAPAKPNAGSHVSTSPNPALPKPAVLPISLTPVRATETLPPDVFAPYGRLIPCETVLTIESNRLDTPVLGLVCEDVWHDGRLIVPRGAEVHGRASTDRARERLAAQGAWTIVWRTPGADNGTELAVQGLALDRERNAATGNWGIHDGSAGLRGEILKTNDWHEVQLFAATFLSTATVALQDMRTTATLLGETLTPAATARNATLAGTSAILREYANQIRQAIERDGIYVRVPAGKPFYLYVTQKLERSRAHRAGSTAHAN